jgi:hypothetical protein
MYKILILLTIFVTGKPLERKTRQIQVAQQRETHPNGHSFMEMKWMIANFEGITLPVAHINYKLRVPTTDDEEILAKLASHGLVSGRNSRRRSYQKKVVEIPKSVLRNFRNIMANLPADVEGSGYF